MNNIIFDIKQGDIILDNRDFLPCLILKKWYYEKRIYVIKNNKKIFLNIENISIINNTNNKNEGNEKL
jgi:hypothetical protein